MPLLALPSPARSPVAFPAGPHAATDCRSPLVLPFTSSRSKRCSPSPPQASRSPPSVPRRGQHLAGSLAAAAELSGMFCRGARGVVQQRNRSLVAASAVATAAAEYVRASKKQRQPEQPSLDALPDECLFEVLRRLPGGRERADSACVSRRWLALLASIRASELGQDAAAPCLPDLNEEFVMEEDTDGSPVADPCVERVLEGKEATDVRLAAMAIVAGSRGGLEKLAVHGSHPTRGVTDQGLLAVARGSPNLCSLALWNDTMS